MVWWCLMIAQRYNILPLVGGVNFFDPLIDKADPGEQYPKHMDYHQTQRSTTRTYGIHLLPQRAGLT